MQKLRTRRLAGLMKFEIPEGVTLVEECSLPVAGGPGPA